MSKLIFVIWLIGWRCAAGKYPLQFKLAAGWRDVGGTIDFFVWVVVAVLLWIY